MNESTQQAAPPPPSNQKRRNPNGFDDPYGDLPGAVKTRTTIDVAAAARADISSVYPNKGYLQTTINILIEKLRQELKRCSLNTYNPEAYERAVADAQILLGGFTYRIHPLTGRAQRVVVGEPTPCEPATTGEWVNHGLHPHCPVIEPNPDDSPSPNAKRRSATGHSPGKRKNRKPTEATGLNDGPGVS